VPQLTQVPGDKLLVEDLAGRGRDALLGNRSRAAAQYSAGPPDGQDMARPRQIAGRARTARVRHYLAAGTLEAGFRWATRQWAERLQRAGLPCRCQEWIGGHDPLWWDQQLPAALAWLLASP
jgi:enterochelin esterase-like enzyme